MLTDYHVHLRPDEDGSTPERYFTASNVERYREAAEERGIEELGVAEHIHRFVQSLDVWEHPWYRHWARDDVDEYCDFVRSSGLKLGIEADFLPEREDRVANLLEPPQGCRFAPRCPSAQPKCHTEQPPLVEVGDQAIEAGLEAGAELILEAVDQVRAPDSRCAASVSSAPMRVSCTPPVSLTPSPPFGSAFRPLTFRSPRLKNKRSPPLVLSGTRLRCTSTGRSGSKMR